MNLLIENSLKERDKRYIRKNLYEYSFGGEYETAFNFGCDADVQSGKVYS